LTFVLCSVKAIITIHLSIVKDSTFGGFLKHLIMKVLYSIPFIQFIDLFLPYKWSSIINFRFKHSYNMFFFFKILYNNWTNIYSKILAISNIFISSSWINNYILFEYILLLFFTLK
jgi:hypothetical protein